MTTPHDPMETVIFEREKAPSSPRPPTLDVLGEPSPTPPRIAVIEEGSPAPGEAFVALQHSRLRSAAGFLAILTSLLAVLFLAAGNAVWLFHGGAAICLWAAFAWLSSRGASRGAL